MQRRLSESFPNTVTRDMRLLQRRYKSLAHLESDGGDRRVRSDTDTIRLVLPTAVANELNTY